MSKVDKIQLSVIWSLAFIAVVVAFLAFSGTFGQPKYKNDSSQPEWLTELNAPAVDIQSAIDSGGLVVEGSTGSVEQSSNFDGNFAQTHNPQPVVTSN